MFGYVRPFVSSLTVGEYEQYKAVYCGVCKAVGRLGGPCLRLTLSYDFVFLALLKMTADESQLQKKSFRCAVNPLQKRCLACNGPALDYAAAVALIMLYYKAVDDVYDKKGLKKWAVKISLPFLRFSTRKARKLYPEIDSIASECVKSQLEAEHSPQATIDLAADPTAVALGKIFSLLATECAQAMYDFGYMLGRWIYLIDAADDLYKDRQSNSFNPFLKQNEQEARAVLNLTVTETALRFDRLPARFRHPIIDNIIAKGLAQTQKSIMNRYNKAKIKDKTYEQQNPV